jgi:hypothetical protein
VTNRRIKSKIVHSFISGGILLLLLSICAYDPLCYEASTDNIDLGLALSNNIQNQQLHVLIILVILIDTVFFCHSLIRLCMLILKPPSDVERPRLPSLVGPTGYANPRQPIPVTLARDEEAVGIDSEATKMPPPAYGLWRESVVCYNYKVSDSMADILTESRPQPHFLAAQPDS